MATAKPSNYMPDPAGQEDLTEKQAAILRAFDEDPDATYKVIAQEASDMLEGDESVTGYYASQQIQKHRPQYFDSNGKRIDASEVEFRDSDDVDTDVDEQRVEELARELDISEDRARVIAQAEEVSGATFASPTESDADVREISTEYDVSVRMTEDAWLRLVGFLLIFSDTQAGSTYEEELLDVASDLAGQALGAA